MTKITGIPAIVVRREQKKGDRPPLSRCEEEHARCEGKSIQEDRSGKKAEEKYRMLRLVSFLRERE